MAKNMMLRKDTPKNDLAPVDVLALPEKRDPMIRDMMMTCSGHTLLQLACCFGGRRIETLMSGMHEDAESRIGCWSTFPHVLPFQTHATRFCVRVTPCGVCMQKP